MSFGILEVNEVQVLCVCEEAGMCRTNQLTLKKHTHTFQNVFSRTVESSILETRRFLKGTKFDEKDDESE